MRNKRKSSAARQTALAYVAVCLFASLQGCAVRQPDGHASDPVPNVVTADIQAGIEKHIAEQSRLNGGYFPLRFGDRALRLKLVRIHTEYLANLGPRLQFACVDLADTAGDVYDVDFFMAGDPGKMTVTETTVHKLNGKPFYFWEQRKDRTWGRVPASEASQTLMGVVIPRDTFEFQYRVILPKITGPARLWIPQASTDAFQDIKVSAIEAPSKHRVLKEKDHGNTVLFWELGPEDSGKSLNIRYEVKRIEKGAYAADSGDSSRHLASERLVPADQAFSDIAAEVVAGKMGDLARARALYDHVMDRMRYAKYGTGWGKGDAVHACNARNGNCTDFHAYFMALARSVGIPARFAIGAAIPSERDEGAIDGYHCWVEFQAEGKWWPVDISEADKYSTLSAYYFGHHPANRIELSQGRDLVVDPLPASGPINFLAYPVLEIDGKPAKAPVTFAFRRTPSA